jgi:hypothetical protein
MHPHRAFVCLVILGGLFALSHAGVAEAQNWTEYCNERYGFSLSYPADLFVVERTAEAGDGQVFVAADADARLLVGAFSNDSGYTPATYRDYIARHSYGQYQIGYHRLGKTWFVLSGEGGGKIFYEKVMFTCAGRLINSFAMIYPSEKRHLFDPVVERIEDTFRPARDCVRAGGVEPVPGARERASRRPSSRHFGERSALADRIARERGQDVFVILRRTSPPYDRKVLRGYVSRP